MEKSLSRLAYDVMRKTAARARKQEKRLRSKNAYTRPSNRGKKGLFPPAQKKIKGGGHKPGSNGEIAKQSLSEEIKGTGGSGSGAAGILGEAARRHIRGISVSLRGRLPDLTDNQLQKVMDLVKSLEVWDRSTEAEQEKMIRSTVAYYGF